MRARRPAVVTGVLALLLVLLAACGQGPGHAFGQPDTAGAAPPHGMVASPTSEPTAAGPWHVVALGDSVTSGAHCNCAGFPAIYARDLARARGARVTVQNLGQGGQTSTGLLGQLRRPGSPQRTAVQHADIVLVTIGANDFSDHHDDVVADRCALDGQSPCVDTEMRELRQNMLALLDTINNLRAGRRTAVLVTGYWNVFQDGAVARRSFSAAGFRATRTLTFQADEVIRDAAEQTGATFVGLYAPFHGPAAHGDVTNLLANDGDHPNAAGQSLIAERLLAAGLGGLVEG
jgi:lysophospholipase L1-like esterase